MVSASGEPKYHVAVRALCDFAARSGDLELRFTPAPTARQGMAGHGVLGARRKGGYQLEVALEASFEGLSVRGRADGYDAEHNRLEEFKTHRGDLARMPGNQRAHHWAQLKIYGAILCGQRGLAEVELALVYFDIKTEHETVLPELHSAQSLQIYFEAQCESYLNWAAQEAAHRIRRDQCLAALSFPHQALRTGQRQLAEAVYKAARSESPLMAQAPTGVGKTVGTLYPLLKAAPKQRLDKIFYLVAKTSGRRVALEALRSLKAGSAIRVIELVAKATACEYPGRDCTGSACPLAKGFYDRLATARLESLRETCLDRETVRRVALAARVCPYYLGQELARWCDVIVGDYNYYFDMNAMLFALATENRWRVGLLVDEAHNLVTRAREMYSVTLDPRTFDAAEAEGSARVQALLRRVGMSRRAIFKRQVRRYAVRAEIPTEFTLAMRDAAAGIAEEIALDSGAMSVSVLNCYFDILRFCRLAESFGEHSLFDVSLSAHDAALCIRNVNPAPFLAARFAACSSSILFSATLAPAEFYRQLLGLPASTQCLSVDSPFAADQLTVRIASRISTRFAHRQGSLRPIAELMAGQFAAAPGNYLAFFSSFDYLQAASQEFQTRFPQVTVWVQARGMTTDERDAFLLRFTPDSSGIAFAVLGGVFAEGVDLPGKRLIGAFIATLGLPQMNEINTQIERRMQILFASGYEYTYLYPGLQKVVQAAGRVVRTLGDHGCVYLMDDRYAAAKVRGLLPAWWRIQCSED